MPLVKLWQLLEHEAKPNIHHRQPEISILDPSWRGTVPIPFSVTDDPASPVLKRYGPILTSDYGLPCVRRVGDTWYLFCLKDGALELGIRTSSDGVTWGPFISLFTSTELGVDYLWCPGVLYDVHLGRWMMYFDTRTGAVRENYYSYCDADPTVKANWSVPEVITLPNRITATINIPRPVKLGRLYYIAYINDAYDTVADRQIVWSHSRDGVNWTFGGLLLEKGAAGEWDDRLIHSFGLTYVSGIYYLVYCGYEEATLIYRIGLSYRVGDLFGLTTKHFLNPIIDYAPDDIAYPTLLMMKEDFRIYYHAWGAITSGLYYVQIT